MPENFYEDADVNSSIDDAIEQNNEIWLDFFVRRVEEWDANGALTTSMKLDIEGYIAGGVFVDDQLEQGSPPAPNLSSLMATYYYLAHDEAAESNVPANLDPYFNAVITEQNTVLGSTSISNVSLASGTLGSVMSTLQTDADTGNISGVNSEFAALGNALNGQTINGINYSFTGNAGFILKSTITYRPEIRGLQKLRFIILPVSLRK